MKTHCSHPDTESSLVLKRIKAYDRLETHGIAVHEDVIDDVLANPLKYLETLRKQAEALIAEQDVRINRGK